MQQDLRVEWLVVVVGDNQAGSQALAAEIDAVDEVESVGPLALGLGADTGGAQAKVELDGEVGRGRG